MGSKIKKNKLIILVLLLLFFAIFVFAQDLEVKYPTVPGAPLPAKPTLPEYIKYVYNFSIIIAGLIAFFSLIYGGFRYLISVGQPAAMADAREQITAGIVGLIILLGSYLFLVAVNPELTILNIGPLDVALRCNVAADCPPNMDCVNGICTVPIRPFALTAQTYRLYEIPIGKLIERVLNKESEVVPGKLRLTHLNDTAQEIKRLAKEIDKKTTDFLNIIQDPCNKCSNTEPDPSECDIGLNYCLPMVCEGDPCLDYCGAPCPGWDPDPVVCTGDPCGKDKRDDAMALKEEIHDLAADLAAEMEAILPDLTSFRKDTQRLELGIQIMKATMYPINYDNMLEMKQVILEIGGDVKIIPFTVLGATIRGGGDPATFYTDEDRIKELMASGDWPTFPTLDTLAICDECEVDIHFSSPELVEHLKGLKDEAADYNPEVLESCGGQDCWDYVINWAEANNWNPAFLLALWREEGGWDRDGIDCPVGAGTIPACMPLGCMAIGPTIEEQLQCFEATTDPATGNCRADNACRPGNTEFCGFVRCWGGLHMGCLPESPQFWPNLFDWYTRLIPGDSDPGINPAAPSGNCTTTAPGGSDPLPPEFSGCPLQPGFSLTCGWEGYPGHRGVDLTANTGDPVYAVADGQATADYSFGLCGIAIRLFTDFGEFRYCHLNDTCGGHDGHLCLADGASLPVDKGVLIGHADATPLEAGYAPHLHLVRLKKGEEASPMECAGIDCIDNAPFQAVFPCMTDSRLTPGLCH